MRLQQGSCRCRGRGESHSEAAGIYCSASAQLQFTTSSSCIIINQLAVSPATVAAADTLNGQYVTPALSCCAHCAAHTPLPPLRQPMPHCPTHSQSALSFAAVTDLFLLSLSTPLPSTLSTPLPPTLPAPLSSLLFSLLLLLLLSGSLCFFSLVLL